MSTKFYILSNPKTLYDREHLRSRLAHMPAARKGSGNMPLYHRDTWHNQ